MATMVLVPMVVMPMFGISVGIATINTTTTTIIIVGGETQCVFLERG